jgi:hypothetical protein
MNDPMKPTNQASGAEPRVGAGQSTGGFSSPKTSIPPLQRGELGEIKDEVKEKSRQAFEEAKSGAQESFQQARQAGRGFVHQRKAMLADKVAEYHDAVAAATGTLEREHNRLAAPSAKAAAQLERFASYLRNHEPEDLVEDLSRFARRRPEVTFGAMFIVGLAAARFLKASARRTPRRDTRSSSVRNSGTASVEAEQHALDTPAVDLAELAAAQEPRPAIFPQA